jgi:hypothetical protein
VRPYDLGDGLDRAPQLAYETFTGNERMNYLMNHDMVHVADRRPRVGPGPVFRSLFGANGPAAGRDHPENDSGYF